MLTNHQASNNKIVELQIDDLSAGREVVAERADVYITRVEVFNTFLLLFERVDSVSRLEVLQLDSEERYLVPQRDDVGTIIRLENPNPDAERFRYGFSSFTLPTMAIEHDVVTRTEMVLKQQEVPEEYDRDQYIAARHWVVGRDGERIPLCLVHRKDTDIDGTAPALLVCYGAYGECFDPAFASVRLSLLDRGFVFALAQVRGGGECGPRWHKMGAGPNKFNSVDDLVACAEHLMTHGYASRRGLAIRGGSAGGFLVAAAMNKRPDLFQAVIAHQPFVDVLNTLLDDSLSLSPAEWEEWGNPMGEKAYEWIRRLSPYDNIHRKDYPPYVLATTSWHDPLVGFWEPAKWILRLREVRSNRGLALLVTRMQGGHQAVSGRLDSIGQLALVFSFIIRAVSGLESSVTKPDLRAAT